jgi:outer membrane protein assembly factor BamB
VAREKVDDTEQSDEPGTADAAGPGTNQPSSRRSGTGGSARNSGTGGSARNSGTAATAARARTVMQRRHLRIGLAMSIAAGLEIAGAVGLVGGGLLPWEWQEPLWGRSGGGPITAQVATALVVLALAVAWWRRGERVPARCRVALLAPAAVLIVVSLAMLWTAELGSRGAGAAVTVLAALLVIAGAVTWLVGLRQLKVLFPFGLADARSRGYGNLATVRRGQRLGLPAGAVGGAALMAGTLLVAPGWLGTVDTDTAAGPLALTGEPPATTGAPAWSLEVDAVPDNFPSTVWATGGGLLVEEATGIRSVDPRTGQARWHWRDEAYRRISGVLTDSGTTVVLALRHVAATPGRDRVVALDAGTGQLRWERFDTDLVTAMGLASWAPAEGDWFVVPEQTEPAGAGGAGTVQLLALGADGETRWRAVQDNGCSFVAVTADASGSLVTTQQCVGDGADEQGQEGAGDGAGCRVSGLDPSSGQTRWSWPPADEPATECQVNAQADLVLVSFTREQEPAAVALAADTGEQRWSAADDDPDGLTGLRESVLAGDALVGTEVVDAGSGGLANGELVVRDAATGEIRARQLLPEGQPVEVVAAGAGHVAVTLYRPQSQQLVVVDALVDGAQVQGEAVVAATRPDAALVRVAMTSGPEALTLDALFALGQEPGPDDFLLQVHGW